MEVIDFLPQYPIANKYDFTGGTANDIYHLKEFYDLRLDKINPPLNPDKPSLQKHQEIIRRLISPYTLFERLLLLHEVGTGKSCAAFAASEINKNKNPSLKKIYVLVSAIEQETNLKNELVAHCYEHVYKKSIRKLKKYKFVTFISFAKMIKRELNQDKQGTYDKYSDCMFIIDEVHKLIPRTEKNLLRTQNSAATQEKIIKDIEQKIENATHLKKDTKKII